MTPNPAVLLGGAFTAPPALIATLVVLVLVVVLGRVLLAITWRVVLVALAVVFGLWLLGAMGI